MPTMNNKALLPFLLPILLLLSTLASAQVVNTYGPLNLPNTWHNPSGSPLALQTFSDGISVNVTGLTQCLHVNASGVVSGTGADCGSGGSGGGNPVLENCTPDQTGNSFFSVTTITNYFNASWQFVFGQASYIICQVYVPTAASGATLVLDIAANDATAGHTANFQTCDGLITTGSINIGALTCAANQTFTTTATAYNRVSLTFNVQSTLSNGSILVVKIATSTTGTAPAANMLVYPHFIL